MTFKPKTTCIQAQLAEVSWEKSSKTCMLDKISLSKVYWNNALLEANYAENVVAVTLQNALWQLTTTPDLYYYCFSCYQSIFRN